VASKVRVETQRPARKKRIRFSEEIVQECLRVLTSGDPEELFEIIPRLGVLRDPRFDKCLLAFLSDKDIKKREFAACAMGAVRRHEFLQPLKEVFMEVRKKKGFGTDEFVLAVIEAIGTLGDDPRWIFSSRSSETRVNRLRGKENFESGLWNLWVRLPSKGENGPSKRSSGLRIIQTLKSVRTLSLNSRLRTGTVRTKSRTPSLGAFTS